MEIASLYSVGNMEIGILRFVWITKVTKLRKRSNDRVEM